MAKKISKIVSLSDLLTNIGNGKDSISGLELIVRCLDKTLPIVKTSYGKTIQEAINLSTDELVIKSIEKCGNRGMLCSYVPISDETRIYYYRYFPLSFEVELLDPASKDFKSIMKKYQDIKFNNMDVFLHYEGMIGSDPEIFVTDENDNLIPAFHFLPDKHNPLHSPGGDYDEVSFSAFGGHGGTAMYWDGFQAEFATNPNTCLGFHINSIAAGLHGIYIAAKKKCPTAKLSLQNVFDIPDEVMDASSDEYVNFGCMPSLNIYGLRADKPPARSVPFRSAGGHIHFGIGKTTEREATPLVKSLDAICGVMCVSLFAEFDNPKRRILYGLPGEFRLPPHGLEYRPLSNAWLSHPLITNMVFDLARKSLVFGKNGFLPRWNATEKETLDTIIQCDVEQAHAIMDRNKDIIFSILKSSYSSAENEEIDMLFRAFKDGIRSVVSNPTDLISNWGINGGWFRHRGDSADPCVSKLFKQRKNNADYKM